MQGWLAKLAIVSVTMLIWGNVASANLPPNSVAGLNEDIQKINTWTSHLNQNDPNLLLQVVVAVDREQTARAVLREINQLKDEIAGVRDFPAGSFTTLACIRPECGFRPGR